MQKSSWMMLGVVAALGAFLAFAYISSRADPGPLTEAQANVLLDTLKDAVQRKDANAILATISPAPETRIKDMTPDQLRGLLMQGFRYSEQVDAQTSNVHFQGGETEAALDYDLTIHNTMQGMASSRPYHVTMTLRPVETPHFLGLYHTKEWKITGATADGPDVGSYTE